jgi:hypothetical protein
MTKKLTVGETIEAVSRLQLKQAVLDELVEFLGQFIPTDSFEPTKGIASPISSDVVPQDVIEEVKDELLATKAGVEKEIKGLKGQSIAGTKAAKKAPVKKKVTKRPPAKRPPPKRRKPSGKAK